MSEFIVYYKQKNQVYITYDYQTGQTDTVPVLPRECNKFEIVKGFEPTFEGLRLYSKALKEANDEIQKSKILPFSYDIFDNKIRNKKTKTTSNMWRSSATATLSFFKRMTPKNTYAMLEDLTTEESQLTELSVKSDIFYAKSKTTLEDAHSYDFRMCYPSLLASTKFFFPKSPGKYIDFTSIDVNITDLKPQYGYYHCQIIIKSLNCRKVFVFNPDNWYTHYDLIIAMKLKKQYGGIELNPLGKAYIYADDDLVCGNDIFGFWYSHLKLLKDVCPKNILVKQLSSSLWGYLAQSNAFKCLEEEAEELNLTTTMDPEKGDYHIRDYVETCDPANNYYMLLDLTKKFQKYPFRVKNFITGFSRLTMCSVLFTELEFVYKIIVDGFLLSKPFKDAKKYKNLIYEPHKSGHVTITDMCKTIYHAQT